MGENGIPQSAMVIVAHPDDAELLVPERAATGPLAQLGSDFPGKRRLC